MSKPKEPKLLPAPKQADMVREVAIDEVILPGQKSKAEQRDEIAERLRALRPGMIVMTVMVRL